MPPSTGAPEHGLAAFIVVIIFLFGWIRSYEAVQKFRVRDVIEGDAVGTLFLICWKTFTPYLEVWLLVLAAVMVMFSTDKILVSIISMSSARVTVGDAYATRIFLSCFKQWQIIGAILMSFGLVIGMTFVFMFWIRMQNAPSEQVLTHGLRTINIFGMVIALNMIVLQSLVSRPAA